MSGCSSQHAISRPELGGSAGSGLVDGSPIILRCAEDSTCPTGNVCVSGNTCAPDRGLCASDGDCNGDSYCCAAGCLDPTAGSGTCIPYGKGPRGNVNSECGQTIRPGAVFSPAVQCEWTGPKSDDPFPDSPNVLTTPLVADLPNDSGAAAEIVVVSYNGNDGFVNPTFAPGKYGVIRILNGQTCQLEETVSDARYPLRASATPALADLDGNGTIEIVARRNDGGLVAFTWENCEPGPDCRVGSGHFRTMWTAEGMDITTQQAWDGPTIVDLDDDGKPEILLRGAVYNGQTGALIYDGRLVDGLLVDGAEVRPRPFNGLIPIVGELFKDKGDNGVKLIGSLNEEITFFGWKDNAWVDEGSDMGVRFGLMASHFALADFGTPGPAGTFDFTKLDGKPEIVAVADETGVVSVHTLDRQLVMKAETFDPDGLPDRGGPPIVGDFDHDGLPEIGVAGKTRFRVFDFECAQAGPGCEGGYVRWSQPSQDASSGQTSAAIFDFDGDGRAEAVYADECFLRVYEGDTGTVLYSAYRTSATWYESPLVADVDRDDSTEIVVNSNAMGTACPAGGTPGTPYVDPIHPGVRCDDGSGCLAGSGCVEGLCRCADDSQCDKGTTCVAPLPETKGLGNVCRATHPNSADQQHGIRVLRDRLDRWASSRPLWNQHAYSITNIDDDGKVPRTRDWRPSWSKGMNSYRQNVQGVAGASDFPDLTGAFIDGDVCRSSGGRSSLRATVCNRGKKAVGAAMPASFYRGNPEAGETLCVAYTEGPVPVGGCMQVTCDAAGLVSGDITMVVNDDGKGAPATAECNAANNRARVTVQTCDVR